jgi:hypothetical protein
MRKLGVLFLISANFYFAQSTVLYNLNNNRLMSNAIDKIGANGMSDDDYEGSPFLEKQFLPSIIKGEKGTYLLRYNIYNDEIILKDGEEYFKIPKEGLDYFIINNKYIIRLIEGNYYIQSSEKKSFAIVRKDNVKFTSSKVSENSYSQNKLAKFSNEKPDYFLYDSQSKKLTPLDKEKLKMAFPNKSNELNQNFKKNKLKNVEDFNELLNMISQ